MIQQKLNLYIIKVYQTNYHSVGMKVQQHQFGLTDIKAAIHLDKIRIRQYCVRHDDGVAIYDTLKYNTESSKNVKNFYLDPKSKLGWCMIPKVKLFYS